MTVGTLEKKNNQWYIGHIPLYPDEDVTQLKEGNVAEFEYDKIFLANETIWCARILPKDDNWDDIRTKFVLNDGSSSYNSFFYWLKENYHPPKKL